MPLNPNLNRKSRLWRAGKILFLIAAFTAMVVIPFLPVVFPDSAVIRLLFGGRRFLLIYLILAFILVPLGLKQAERQRRARLDQHPRDK
jgi:uncharacterized RDD family membrane protein YckC